MKKRTFLFMAAGLMLAGISALPGCCCRPAKCPQNAKLDFWPDREWLAQSVIADIPSILATYHPETGEFGEAPWICQDQNVLFLLAVAWGTESKDNPYYHSDELLKIIAKAGDRLVAEQDAKGMWIFRKKDNSTWGPIHMPWTYTRWIRAYHIVKDALPADAKARWEKGLKLGYSHIVRYCQEDRVHNIGAYHAAGLYVAGLVFNNDMWKNTAREYMHKVCAKQAPDGFWSEHHGPVVSYNFVYLEALGIYVHYAKDPVAQEALSRGARFHAAMRWQDGSMVSVVDERNCYARGRRVGNVGFASSPEGRRYLIQQLEYSIRHRRNISGEFAATMLWEGGEGPAAPEPQAESRFVSRDGQFSVTRSAPFQWVFSAYACQVPLSRWIMDRQTHVEIAHDYLGVIGSGGNTKMQPYFSTFTFGDPDSFQPDYSTTRPKFRTGAPVDHVPDTAKINGNSLDLTYGKNLCRVTVKPMGEELFLTYSLLNKPDAAAAAHFPVILSSKVRDGNGKELDAKKVYSGKDLANILQYNNGVTIHVPDDARIRPRVIGFNPYQKYGKGASARLVITLPLSADRPEQTIRFSRRAQAIDVSKMEIHPAEGLPMQANGCSYKPLELMNAIFVRTPIGGEVSFTIRQPEAATREVYVEMVQSYIYGIVQVLVNGKKVGKPFSVYSSGVDIADPRFLGKADFKEGDNQITFRTVGKEKASGNSYLGVRNIYLK